MVLLHKLLADIFSERAPGYSGCYHMMINLIKLPCLFTCLDFVVSMMQLNVFSIYGLKFYLTPAPGMSIC